MYTLKKITAHNFRLLKTSFPVRRGLFFVGGDNRDVPVASSNMAGKTTVASAVTFALYGVDVNGNRLADDAVRHGKDRAYVYVRLVCDQKTKPWEIVRYRYNRNVPTGQSRNWVAMWIHGKKIEGPADEMQDRINHRLGDVDLFLAAHVFGKTDTASPFAERPDREQKRLFDLLVGYDDLNDGWERTQQRKKELDYLIANHHAKQHRIEGEIVSLRGIQANQQKENGREIYQQRKAEYSAAAVARKRAERAAKKAQKECDALDREVETHRARLAKLHARRERQTAQVAGRLETLTKSRDQLVSGGLCPTCFQYVNPTTHKIALDELQDKIDKLSGIAHHTDDDITRVEQRLRDAERRSNGALTVRQEKQTKADRTLRREQDARDSLNEARTTYQNQKDADQNLACDIRDRERALRTVHRRLFRMKTDRRIVELMAAAFGPTGIRVDRLNRILPRLNAIAARVSDALFGDGTVLQYATQSITKAGKTRERFDCALYCNDERQRVLSSGQAMRRDIAHTLSIVALADELRARSVDILILDELFVNVDVSGIHAILSSLRGLADRLGTVWVVEHDDELRAVFDQSIVVVREKGKSHVCYDTE